MRPHLIVFSILASTQMIAWGAVGFLAVVATQVGEDLGVALPVVFLGTSVMFVAMGLASPFAGKGFAKFGARRVMALGAALIGAGFCVIASAPSEMFFLFGWALTGIAGSMFLTTAAYVYLADNSDDRARSMIGTLMLVTGLAGSVFWPITAFLDQMIGWRGAAFVYAGVMALLICPLVFFGLPETQADETSAPSKGRAVSATDPTFLLIVLTIVLNGFVTFGIETVGIELLRAMGTELSLAVGIASLLGFFKVSGRVIDLLGGKKWDGLSTARVSGATIPLGLMALAFGGIGFWPLAGFLCLFGVGSGAFAVARATMPLVFYKKSDYAAAMATIALPMNLINAFAPPALATLLVESGPYAVLALLAGISSLSFVALLNLKKSGNT